jgi:hypothetical protein
MTSPDAVREIIATYVKHGWVLRRVLLSEASKAASADLFADTEFRASPLDAAWFSRPPQPGETAWELRYLGDIPFALLEHVDENSPEFEAALAAVEARMAETIAKKQRA